MPKLNRYAAVTAHAWMCETGAGTDYVKHETRENRDEAVKDGIRLAGGTDDFLIARFVDDELRDLTNEGGDDLDWSPDSYADFAVRIGLKFTPA